MPSQFSEQDAAALAVEESMKLAKRTPGFRGLNGGSGYGCLVGIFILLLLLKFVLSGPVSVWHLL